ncbi:FAD-dependent monooxygenase [Kribbella sp. NBC_01505]|uniref:FAD-dependent oxidoreductase n=1 Tax=Kribbella sp. NBC_01505 TaxID=2903580 RepID=UPI00386F694D
MHVVIIGGGIGGLCLAQGLVKAGVSVAVYERDAAPDARLQGYRLNIEPQGSRALHACLPDHLWQILVATAGDPGPGMGVFTEGMRELMREDGPPAGLDPAVSTHAVSRVSLRGLLLAGLDEVVHFGKEFQRYRHEADGSVTAEFADGSTANGTLLVGADGGRSRVRRQLLPAAVTTALPAFGVGGKVPLTDRTASWLPEALTRSKNMVLPQRDFLFTAVFRRREQPEELAERMRDQVAAAGLDTKTVLADVTDDDYVMWAYVAHRRHIGEDLTGQALLDRVDVRMRDWDPGLRALLSATPAETVDRFDFSTARRVAPWPTTTVTVLGDAIHHMPPVGGLGGNAALHDALLLRDAITDVHDGRSALLPALRGYEAAMLTSGFGSVRQARLYVALAISPSRVLRTVARGFFRLCGAIGPLRRVIFQDG